jgi:hypothetical protein
MDMDGSGGLVVGLLLARAAERLGSSTSREFYCRVNRHDHAVLE